MPGTVTGAKDIVFNESHIHIFMESYQKDWPMPVNLVSQQTGTPKSPRFSSSPCLKSAGRARKLKTQKKSMFSFQSKARNKTNQMQSGLSVVLKVEFCLQELIYPGF